jgi:hypothetical protein
VPYTPDLEDHEQRDQAEHAALRKGGFLARVSITVAVLAVLAASTGSLETFEASSAITASNEAVLAQDRSTDAWNQYQADNLKMHVYGIAADRGGPHAAAYRATAEAQAARLNEVRHRAAGAETERNRLLAKTQAHEHRHHWLTIALTLLEIAIAVCTVALVTRRDAFWISSLGLGVAGLVVVAAAYSF